MNGICCQCVTPSFNDFCLHFDSSMSSFDLQFYLTFRGLKADTVGEEQFAEFVLT